LTQVVTEAEIEIDNDVILDGEAKLIVDGNLTHSVFSVPIDVTAELRGMVITRGYEGGIINLGDLTLTSSWVVYNTGQLFGGIANDTSGTLHVRHSIVQGNVGMAAGGIDNLGTMTLTHTTVIQNTGSGDGSGAGIVSRGPMTLTHSTVSENSEGIWTNPGLEDEPVTVINSTVSGNKWRISAGTVTIINSTVSCAAQTPPTHYCTVNDSIILIDPLATVALSNTLIHGACDGVAVSSGYNIETPGGTCGFDQPTDLSVDWAWLNLEPLAYNGGWTETHALGLGSAAINRIPTEECVDADGAPLTTDQRGFPRPVPILGADPKCDVGAFELQGGTGVPAGWTCPPENYGAADGCHCGCGVIDLDCADGTVASCDYCGEPGSCTYGCPGCIDPAQNWICGC
jgi:hypothetical protein